MSAEDGLMDPDVALAVMTELFVRASREVLNSGGGVSVCGSGPMLVCVTFAGDSVNAAICDAVRRVEGLGVSVESGDVP